MKKVSTLFLSILMICAIASGALAFTRIDIDNNNILTGSVGGYTNFTVGWISPPGFPYVPFGVMAPANANVQSGDAYIRSLNKLRVILESNEQPADYAAIIYLRNWDAAATPHMTTDPSVGNQQKGLVGPGGTTAVGMKWARAFGNPNDHVAPPPGGFTQEIFEDGDTWRWLLDITYTWDPPDPDGAGPEPDPAPDSMLKSDAANLNYATFITQADLEWAGTNTVDLYFMARLPQGSPAGNYRTSTLTIEAYYE